MNLNDIIEIVDGTPLNPEVDMNIKIRGGIGADLMSDVLASSQPKALESGTLHRPTPRSFQANAGLLPAA